MNNLAKFYININDEIYNIKFFDCLNALVIIISFLGMSFSNLILIASVKTRILKSYMGFIFYNTTYFKAITMYSIA